MIEEMKIRIATAIRETFLKDDNDPLNTTNPYTGPPKIISIQKKIIKVAQDRGSSLIAINKRLRGEQPPQVCTCSTNHGFH